MNLFGFIFFGLIISIIVYNYNDLIKNYILNNWFIIICVIILIVNFIINICKKNKMI